MSLLSPYTTDSIEGRSKATTALVCGIIGLFIFGLILGPIAIVMASKAQALGVKATGGKVLGWIDVIFGILGLAFIILANANYHG